MGSPQKERKKMVKLSQNLREKMETKIKNQNPKFNQSKMKKS
jgi:hypothetical protein